uniref:EEF1A lysine methyltransferase 2 n=2 Tax=Paramormyrops kingsleyae TaxID=1676925 RepID=A0A3B3R732_9TELE|nr:EEF1A lysine methyltransferase 2 [Paramormyrops kingsleyae]
MHISGVSSDSMDSKFSSQTCHHAARCDEKEKEDEYLGEDFLPSKLGTKEYWDDAYQRELQAFEDIGDVGEIWFGEESMGRVVRWLDKMKIPRNAAILDIGTGNGVFLVELAKHGFTNLTGIDYSTSAVKLSHNILEKEGLSNVKVKEIDFLSFSEELGSFDVSIDKGTFDAITLSVDAKDDGKERYVKALLGVLRMGGFFVITSCNWTKEQLLDIFSNGFKFLHELPTPGFQFGGRTGNSVTVLVLERI